MQAKGELPMSRQKQEGDRRICSECQTNGINSEIICKKMKDGNLSWRNFDGSAHFYPVLDDLGNVKEDESGHVMFEHCPITKTPLEVWQQEIEERLARVERTTGIMWGE